MLLELLLGLSLVLAATAGQFEIDTVSGTGAAGYAGDGGPASAAQLRNPYGLCIGPDAALYICDMDNQVIRRVKDGVITTVAGSGRRGYAGDGGPALAAELNEPYEIRFDPAGNLCFVEMRSHLVRRVSARTGIISTLAGAGAAGFSGDGGPAVQARLNQPHSIQFDRQGHLYICDIGNHRIRKVDARTGLITTLAGTGEKKTPRDGGRFSAEPLFGPRALDFDREGFLWLALREGNALYRLDLSQGTLRLAAGTGDKGSRDGPALQATLSGPKGISVAPDGDVYFADTESHTIRRLNRQTGQVETVAGTGAKGDGPDGAALRCQLARPHGIFAARDGAIYIGDSENHRVRKLVQAREAGRSGHP